MSAPSLSADEHARFREQGFLVREGAFGPEPLAEIEAAFERLRVRAQGLRCSGFVDGSHFVVTPGDPERIHRVVWCGAAEPALAAVGRDPRVLGPALELLGVSEADQLVNQAHFKQPHDGVSFPLHQDAWNRRHGTALWRDPAPDGGYVQVLLAVDAMTPDNGPLLAVPGSHRAGPIRALDRAERIAALEPHASALELEPGSLVFFGPFLVHGSRPNTGDRPRRALVNGYCRPGSNRRIYPGAGQGARRKFLRASF